MDGNRIEIQVSPYVWLRQLTVADAPVMFALVESSRDHLSQHGDLTAAHYPTLEAVVRRISIPGELRFGIWDGALLVGFIKLTLQDNSRAEVGYWLGAAHTGMGYMTCAVQALTAWAMGQPGIDEVYGRVVKSNLASLAVLMGAGYSVHPLSGNDQMHLLLYPPMP